MITRHQRRHRGMAAIALTTSALLLTTATGAAAVGHRLPAAPEISGDLTILTHRTDIVDTVLADYRDRFNETYPDVDITFEAITDYEGEVRIRMNTEDYGDVLHIPNNVNGAQLADFFDPLGTVEELSETYRFVSEKAYDGQVYGLATTGNANGFVYNRAVFEAAGVAELPTTPEEFLAALEAIAANTDAIPLYTNYSAGWPLAQWESNRGSITDNPDYVIDLAHTDAPWTEGTDHFVIDSLLWEVVERGLTEEDPTTTDWESSKPRLGSGEIAVMPLGSWAIVQMQEAAENPDDIGYMPFPSQVDGTFHSAVAGDYKVGINRHSDNKDAARAWIDFFVNESGFAFDQGGVPPRLDGEFPPQLADFDALGVELVELSPAPAGEEGLTDEVDAEAEIGLFEALYRQRIVDAARGQTDESLEEIFADLNERWAAARAELDID